MEEASQMMADERFETKVLAGGTDLIPQMRSRKLVADRVIDLSEFSELKGIQLNEEHIWIGSFTTVHELEQSSVLKDNCGLLQEAAGVLGPRQVRNIATIGGNICNASPSGDLLPALLVLDAQVVFSKGLKTMESSIHDFFLGPSQTILGREKILIGVKIPIIPRPARACYLKLTPRRAMDLAVVGVAVLLDFDDNGTCRDSRIALGSVAPTPIRAREAEDLLTEGLNKDKDVNGILIKVGELARRISRPISDVRASKEYRLDMVPVLVKRAIKLGLTKTKYEMEEMEECQESLSWK
jgi:carbon-monoxide dehydrogenase medium subunit